MDTETQRTLERLNEIADELRLIAQRLADGDGEPLFPADAAEKVRKRICLQRGFRVSDDDEYKRGLCVAAYAETKRRLDAHQVSERELIENGLLAPKLKPGRRKAKSALDGLLDKKDGDKASESADAPQRSEPQKNLTDQEAFELYKKYENETEEELLAAMIKHNREASRKLNAPKEVVPKKKAAKKKAKKAAKKKGEVNE